MRSPSAAPIRHDLVLVGGGHAHIQVPQALGHGAHPRRAPHPRGGPAGRRLLRHGARLRGRPVLAGRPRDRRASARPACGSALHHRRRPPVSIPARGASSWTAGRRSPTTPCPSTWARRWPGSSCPASASMRSRRARSASSSAAWTSSWPPRAARDAARLVVAGAGAGGVEVAFALAARLRPERGGRVEVLLLESGPRVLPGYAASAAARVQAAALARGIVIRTGARVTRVETGAVHLDGGERLPADAVVWVAGAAALPIFQGSGLETDEGGFVRIRPTLQCVGHDDVFAVGDCAAWTAGPGLAKAGVYAVRQGPVLAHNLMARIGGARLRPYRPQRDFLSLLNLGDGGAIGTKWGVSVQGSALFALKDWIDRRFVRRFQVLDRDGAITPDFAAATMPGGDMLCGGCAAKVGESSLTRALERLGVPSHPAVVLGLAQPDDAAAVETERGEIVAATVDSFRAFADDPYLVGRVAAVNAVSDLWAKGGDAALRPGPGERAGSGAGTRGGDALPGDGGRPRRAGCRRRDARGRPHHHGARAGGGLRGLGLRGVGRRADPHRRRGARGPADPDQAARHRCDPAGRHAGARARRVGRGRRRLDAPRQRGGRPRDDPVAALGRHRRHRLRPGGAPGRDAAREQGLGSARPHRDSCAARRGGAAGPRHPQHRASGERRARGGPCSWSRTRRDGRRSTCSSIPRPREGCCSRCRESGARRC